MPNGLNSDANFERTFADLASAVLQDRSPALLDYMVGFQVLDTNEEQTKAVGVFGCKVGNEMVYLPVFFMNGELKGSELMYLKSQDLFCPSSEAWVTYLLNRKPYKLGDVSEKTKSQVAQSAVDLLPFRTSPERFGKSAEFKNTPARSYVLIKASQTKGVPCWGADNVQEWVAPFVAAAKRNPSDPIYKEASDRLDFGGLLRSVSLKDSAYLFGTMSKQAEFAESVIRYYPLPVLKNILNTRMEKVAAKPNVPDVRIVSYKEKDLLDGLELSDVEKKKLINGEVLIKDHRNDTSKVFKLNVPMRAQSLSESGVYAVPLEDGSVVRALVLVGAYEVGKYSDMCCGPKTLSPARGEFARAMQTHVVNLDGQGYWSGTNENLLVSPIDNTKNGFASEFADMVEVSAMKEGEIYCVVSASGSSIAPFRVCHKDELPDGTISFKVSRELYPYNKKTQDESTYQCCFLTLRPRVHGGMERINDTIYLSESCRACKVDIPEAKYSDEGYRISNLGDPYYGMRNPANMKHIEQLMWRNGSALPLKLQSNGTEFKITLTSPSGETKAASDLKWRDALETLVFNLGIQGETARTMLKEASVGNRLHKYLLTPAKPYEALVKSASPFLAPGTMTAPSMDMNMGAGFDNIVGVPSQTSMTVGTPVQSMAPEMGNFNLYNPNTNFDRNPYQVLQEAAQTGQKEVFDTALISTLVNSSNNDKLIDKYVGDLILGLDRIGRIYFLFLQHNEEFEERYGQEDMIELEDNLRNTFESVGDLVLFLKQKTVESSKSTDRTKISL